MMRYQDVLEEREVGDGEMPRHNALPESSLPRRVWKFAIPGWVRAIPAPRDARVVHLAVQDTSPVLWIEASWGEETHRFSRKFALFYTGVEIDPEYPHHVGSTIRYDGIVLHCYSDRDSWRPDDEGLQARVLRAVRTCTRPHRLMEHFPPQEHSAVRSEVRRMLETGVLDLGDHLELVPGVPR